MVWFREGWPEEVLRQLRQGLIKCYQVAFETRSDGKFLRLLHFLKRWEQYPLISWTPALKIGISDEADFGHYLFICFGLSC